MSQLYCFVIKKGTDFDKAVKEHFELRAKWDGVFDKVSDLLGEKITKIAFSSTRFIIEPSELINEHNKNLFKKDGELKTNSNKAKNLLEKYKEIIQEVGLSEFKELREINFRYGVMRTHGQELESFVTSENDIYYKTNFDLEKRTNGLVIPITEIEYEETYLNELKKREKDNKDEKV